ncbi:hypothetical protein K504DRAFT_463266 [Pleomassaria siparia CBS 279.74]|uniref:Uncharacterized protein n=1 Tax=Pleomassaria siparia CBS 279.74 TaxID=1314801 RepID=A0A6G1JTH1_9PLEO|nr:hypothetical protein K504DRAFT_463266 [Pleomassaria siparia CBS 279.74]
MSSSLDTRTIRASTQSDLAQHLRHVRKTSSDSTITRQLLKAIECGSILPSAFAVWLGVSRSPHAVTQAWKQKFSVQIRHFGTKRLSKLLHSPQWSQIWESLGGTQGLLDCFSDFSVLEVKNVCLVIGASINGQDLEEKRERVTELLQALMPRLFPHTQSQTPDLRPLFKIYQHLVPGCTPDLVTSVLNHKVGREWSHFHIQHLFRTHPGVLRDLSLQTVFNNRLDGGQWLMPLIKNQPPTTGAYPKFSASMQFSLDVLRLLVKEETSAFPEDNFVESLAEPLLKRALRKRVDWTYIEEMFDLIVYYLKIHPVAASKLQINCGRLLHFAAICWSNRAELFESSFTALLSLWHKGQTSSVVQISSLEVLLKSVAKFRRYDLLRFCYKTLTAKNIDYEKDLKEAEGSLLPRLLDNLQPEQALGLFTRLRRARGDKGLVHIGPPGLSITGVASVPDERMGDADMFQVVLMQRNGDAQNSELHSEKAKRFAGEAEQLARTRLEDQKKRAMSSSDQSHRAHYAQSALSYSIASRSLQLYKETQIWARRFIRDPLTARLLHCHYPDEAIGLLAGIPVELTKNDRPSDIRLRIEEANEILLDLFETMRLALREPSFAKQHWGGALGVFPQVVEERMRRSASLKKVVDQSDDEVYDVIWKDTLAMLLTLEEEALKGDIERLGVDGLGGPLSWRSQWSGELKNAEPSTYRFLDDLARARNELWITYRPSVHPGVTTLPDPFPRGLPIQHLTGPHLIANPALENHCPYLSARANAAVYLNPTAALTLVPTDKETRAAIGLFVDDFGWALRMLMAESREAEAKERLNKAYAHLIGPLSEARMSRAEALRYWYTMRTNHDILSKLWPSLPDSDQASGRWSAIFPQIDDPTETEEWNPMPPPKSEIKSRPLELTYIDLSKLMPRAVEPPTIRSDIYPGTCEIPGQNFDQNPPWSASRPASEGEILAALLYLDAQNSTTSRILASPFPSTEDVRYPSVYLDETFLSTEDSPGSRKCAIEYLTRYNRLIPPSLIAQLAQNTMSTMADAAPGEISSAYLERDAFLLLHLLSMSDRPSLASELIVKTIIEHPEASSWHRRLLSGTFLRRLPASDAKECFEALATSIIAKLEEQADTKKSTHVQDAPEQPLVKVTTVKYLAQLLQKSDFVSEDLSLSVLSILAHKSSHLDIRKAVVNCLLNLLEAATMDRAQNILAVLEDSISIAGNLNERHPITAQDWKVAEETLDLPEVANGFDSETSPILHTLTSFFRDEPPPRLGLERDDKELDVKHRKAFFERIILPSLEILKHETTRWVNLFLRKHGIDDEAQEKLSIRPLPKGLLPLVELASSYLPAAYLEEYIEGCIFNISPPPAIKELNKRLDKDAVLQTHHSIKFWHSLTSSAKHRIHFPKYPLAALLAKPSALPEETGITTKKVQESFLRIATALVWNDGPRYKVLNAFVQRHLRPTRFDRKWLEGQKPIVEAFYMYVETLRTKDWERDAKRQPLVLPDTFPYRLWLLKYPQDDPTTPSTNGPLTPEEEAKCKVLADVLAKTVDQICGRIYHVKFERIKQALKTYVTGKYRWAVACYLGNIEKTRLSWLTRPDELRVELAAWLFTESVAPREFEGKKRVESVLASWSVAESEEIRRLGLTTTCGPS